MPAETTYKTKYGTVVIKDHAKVDNTGCVQITEYTSHSTGEKVMETIHCANTKDFSRQDGIKYDAKCYLCYAGIGHTRERHNKLINH